MLWEAETDGIINVQFQAAPQSTSASITLKTKGRDNLEPVPWTVYSSPLGDQAMSNDQINIPIRRRSQVQLEALGHNQGGGTGEMISLHQLDIIFTPFGVGKLVEIAKKE